MAKRAGAHGPMTEPPMGTIRSGESHDASMIKNMHQPYPSPGKRHMKSKRKMGGKR
jgi:hypothetical protein